MLKVLDKPSMTFTDQRLKTRSLQLEMVQDMGEGLDQIIRWRNKPLSFVSMIIFVLVTYYIELWMVPLAIGLLLLYSVSIEEKAVDFNSEKNYSTCFNTQNHFVCLFVCSFV